MYLNTPLRFVKRRGRVQWYLPHTSLLVT